MLFLGICFLLFIIFATTNKEGSTDKSTKSKSAVDGIGGNAVTYADHIKTISTQIQDELLISKYRTQYEDVITDMDDLVDNLMLKTVLSIDTKKPVETLIQLNALNASKESLNNIMKFIDKT